MKRFFIDHFYSILYILTGAISIGAFLYFYFNGNQNLGNYDAVARLNIARKVIDSQTPGFGQLGGIWLPFPQVFMIPFVGVEFFWKTGLAGAFISCTSFIFGAVYLLKTAFLLTNSIKASLLAWGMFVANINILLLQTMALSEMFFLTCLIMIIYFLIRWIQTHNLLQLMFAGVFLIGITLTRYEGYFVFMGATLVVLFECIRIYWRDNKQKIEGIMLLYFTIAGFGIFLWCLYCFLFFNDFFFWLHIYSGGKLQVSTATQAVTATNEQLFEVAENSIGHAFQTYSQVILWMNGKITVLLGFFGFIITVYILAKNFLKKKSFQIYIPLLFISVVLYIFLVYGYQKGFIPLITIPPELLEPEARKSFTLYTDSNIRYGIILAPCIILFAGIAAARNLFFYFAVLILFILQLFVNNYKPDYLQYSLPKMWPYSTLSQVPWFKSHYDNGLILISANAHEDFVFQLGLPYKSFIYEGSREYWMQSLNDPSKYNKWVILDDRVQGDTLNFLLTDNAREILRKKFVIVYDVNGFKVYKLR